MSHQHDIIILSNGPGEVTTWVLPVVRAIRRKFEYQAQSIRISVVLSPCPHATGKEASIVSNYPEVDRVQSAEYFWPFLLWGKTLHNWDWHQSGVVIFLGGDQFFSVVIGKRLGYTMVVYAEWEARWYQWINRFALMKSDLIKKVPTQYHHKLQVVGDLMIDLESFIIDKPFPNNSTPIIGLLPGSKPAKLTQGVPFCLAIAEKIHQQKPETSFFIPVAPTLNIETLAKYANINNNPFIKKLGGVEAQIIKQELKGKKTKTFLQTTHKLNIELVTEFPAYNLLSQSNLCLTTVGANTAQLGALGIPMIVILPTYQLDAMRSWDGIVGILANLPGIGYLFARGINWFVIRQKRLFAWPNIWAQKEIVPELVGELTPQEIAEIVLDWLENSEKLQTIHHELSKIRRETGASDKIAQIVWEELAKI